MANVLEITLKVRDNSGEAATLSDVLKRASATPDKLGPEVLPLNLLTQIYVRHVLDLCEGNKSRAARLLGVSRRSLYRLIEAEAA